jgi:hypothetical protein
VQNCIASLLEGIRTWERAGCAREKEVAGSREETSPGAGMHLAGRPRSCRWSREAEETSPGAGMRLASRPHSRRWSREESRSQRRNRAPARRPRGGDACHGRWDPVTAARRSRGGA